MMMRMRSKRSLAPPPTINISSPHDPPLLPYLLLSEEEDDASRSRFSLFFRSMDPAKSVLVCCALRLAHEKPKAAKAS
jgi:hypothetical protein